MVSSQVAPSLHRRNRVWPGNVAQLVTKIMRVLRVCLLTTFVLWANSLSDPRSQQGQLVHLTIDLQTFERIDSYHRVLRALHNLTPWGHLSPSSAQPPHRASQTTQKGGQFD